MQDILFVYQDVNFQNSEEATSSGVPEMVTVSVDEKPGVQAIKNIARDLAPVAPKHSSIGRDYESCGGLPKSMHHRLCIGGASSEKAARL
jgi:hypothetical protein